MNGNTICLCTEGRKGAYNKKNRKDASIEIMLIIDGKSVYEIDEECLAKRKVPEECEVYRKILQKKEQTMQMQKTRNDSRLK